MSSGFEDAFRWCATKASNTDPMFDGSEVDAWADKLLGDILDEPTVELKCSCGAWKVYGRACSLQFHQDYCDLKRRD